MRKVICLLLSFLPFLASCDLNEFSQGYGKGNSIKFSANTYYNSGLLTKTEYSGIGEYSGAILTKEQINWLDTDTIRIYSAEATTRNMGNHYADYAILPSGNSKSSSNASLSPVGQNGLTWGLDDSYTFFAIYPSPERVGVASDLSISGNVITASLPQVQKMGPPQAIIENGQTVGYLYKPDMNYAYMWAASKVSRGDMVSLKFQPLMTAFEITLDTDIDDELSIDEVFLSTDSEGTMLTGDFTVSINEKHDNSNDYDFSFALGTNNYRLAKASFGDNGVTITKGKPITFTLFTLPQDQTNVSLTLVLSNGETRTIKFRHSDNFGGGYVTFNACTKIHITTPKVDDYWEYHMEFSSTATIVALPDGTEAQVSICSNPIGDYYHMSYAPFLSYKNHPGSTEQIPVACSQEFEYALSDGNGDPVLDSDGNIAWTSEKPEDLYWLSAYFTDYPATAATTFYTSIPTIDDHSVLVDNNERLARAVNLKAKGLNGFTSSSPQDLSLYDIDNLTSERVSHKPITANCYVVDRAGWYMFPLVYGNSIDYSKASEIGSGASLYINGINRFSYTDGTGEINTDAFWHTFQNYKGQSISSPYILDDTGVSNVDAVIVWEDVDAPSRSFIQNVSVINISTNNVYYDPVLEEYKTTMPYIKFEIPRGSISDNTSLSVNERITGIRQGNAVIALRDTDDIDPETNMPRILWSWHIWITDGYDTDGDGLGDGLFPINVLAASNSNRESYSFMPVDLGWCNTNSYTTYKDRVWYVKVHQDNINGEYLIFKIIQQTEPTRNLSSGTFYQSGRKDPLLPGVSYDEDHTKNKDVYSPAGYIVVEDDQRISFSHSPSIDASSAIQHPYTFYSDDNSIFWISNEQDSYFIFHNLWDMNDSGDSWIPYDATSKTIYDPCPPHYRVPDNSAFYFFVTNGETNFTDDYDVFNVDDRNGDGTISADDYENGWYFKTGHSDNLILFTGGGERHNGFVTFYQNSLHTSGKHTDYSEYGIGYYSGRDIGSSIRAVLE